MILLIDNYDSFVHNLARHFERLDQETVVVRNDAITPAGIRRLEPQAIVLSPGPCTPNEAGCSVATVRELAREIPLLGVCLGHQAIAAALGAMVIRAAEPRHGRTSLSNMRRRRCLPACRRRSRPGIIRLPSTREPAGGCPGHRRADDGCVMGLEHQRVGVWRTVPP
jgi:anthranilate synthase/aminodeoxychorismate synthase-like glutamine amidotransferase